MTKTQTASAWDKFKNTKVSLVTGTLAIATAAIAAYAVMPSAVGIASTDATLLQASVFNIMSAVN